jgi:hypothetical protein
LEKTFHITTELFGSPINCPMTEGMTYCSAFPEDVNFGAIIESFQYRWIASCIANPEYEPEDMLKAVLQALSSSDHTDAPFLAVMALPVWDDSPWTFNAIRIEATPTCPLLSAFRVDTCALCPLTNKRTRLPLSSNRPNGQ